jgi:GNAT superfamily N-acetyltransferase
MSEPREFSAPAAHIEAFREIDEDRNQLLLVVRDRNGELVGTMQLTLIPGLSRGGAKRLHIEAVRVAASARGGGLGSALFDWAHAYGRSRGATLAQLTSDKSRSGAHRFYEKLGYRASHEGFKYQL